MALYGQLRRKKYLAEVPKFHVFVRVYVHVHVRVLSFPVSVSKNVSVSMSVSVSISFSVLFQFKYGALNIYGRHGKYIVDCQGTYGVARKLKEPLI
jgi:hypothetical protein